MKNLLAVFAFVCGVLITSGFFLADRIQSFWTMLCINNETSAIALTGIIGAIVAIWGIMSQRAIARRQATLEHISHQEADKDLIEARKEFIKLAKNEDGLAKFSLEDKETSDEAKSIKLVLNEFELIAIGIEIGIIDYNLYRLWHRSGVIRYWSYAEPFVTALRSRTGNDMLYHEFESMAGWFKGTKKPKRGYLLGQWIK